MILSKKKKIDRKIFEYIFYEILLSSVSEGTLYLNYLNIVSSLVKFGLFGKVCGSVKIVSEEE